ncbi:MAG: hypothetical protein V1495_08085 [Pseudomonadota bacterium]
MNQALGTMFAMTALLSIGLFNLVLGISNVRKRNRSRFWGWTRIVLGSILLLVAAWFYLNISRDLVE